MPKNFTVIAFFSSVLQLVKCLLRKVKWFVRPSSVPLLWSQLPLHTFHKTHTKKNIETKHVSSLFQCFSCYYFFVLYFISISMEICSTNEVCLCSPTQWTPSYFISICRCRHCCNFVCLSSSSFTICIHPQVQFSFVAANCIRAELFEGRMFLFSL